MFNRISIVNLFYFALSFACSDEPTTINELQANVETYAGGESGFVDGPALQARFAEPLQIAITPTGAIYVIDQFNRAIRKIDESGIVSTIIEPLGYKEYTAITSDGQGQIYVATDGQISRLNGNKLEVLVTGTDGFESTYFYGVEGLAIHPDGNIYFTERSNYKIMKLSLDGTLSKYAGGKQGFKDGLVEQAEFNGINRLYISNDGLFYISDAKNHKIRKISSGSVTTIAGTEYGFGDGPGNNSRFAFPNSLTKDKEGSLYVADEGNDCIRKISVAQQVSTIADDYQYAGYSDGIGIKAKFFSPRSIAINKEGVLYVCDQKNHRIRKITFK